MAIPSVMSLFSSFFGGPKLVTGAELKTMAQMLFQATTGIVALAGGGQTGATPLPQGIVSVDTVASANDSVMLPPAIPGNWALVINNTANSMQVFGQVSNAANGGAGDTIAVQASTTQVATGTGVAQASGVKAYYWCAKVGQWQRGSVG